MLISTFADNRVSISNVKNIIMQIWDIGK